MPDPKEQARPPKRKIQADTIIAVCAVLISLCALVISLMENRLMRHQQKVAVYPHLDLNFRYNSEGFSIYVSNKGPGLAFIENVQVWYEDKYFADWKDIADFFMPEGHQITYSIYKTGELNEEIISGD